MKNNHLAETNICEVVEIVWKQFWKHLQWHEFYKVFPRRYKWAEHEEEKELLQSLPFNIQNMIKLAFQGVWH